MFGSSEHCLKVLQAHTHVVHNRTQHIDLSFMDVEHLNCMATAPHPAPTLWCCELPVKTGTGTSIGAMPQSQVTV